MATRNNRDVRLGIEIETTGEERLGKVAAELRALAKAGGDAAPELQALATELDRAAAQSAALETFKRATTDLAALTTTSREAAAASDRLKTSLEGQRQELARLRDVQTAAQQALDATQRSIAAANREQQVARQALRDQTITQEQYKTELSRTNGALATLREQLVAQRQALRESKAEAAEAARETERLRAAAEGAEDKARGLAAALRQQTEATEAAAAAGARLGADFTDVAAAQERIETALAGGVAALQRNATAARELAEADRLLAIEARGLAEARERGRVAAESELAAIRESVRFSEQFAAQQRQTAAAVQALTDDLDRQAATVAGNLVTSLQKASDAYEKEQAALRETLALQERRSAAAAEQAEADRLATLAANGLAEARERGRLAAQSELVAIRESEQFSQRFEKQQRDTAAAVEALTNDLDRQAELVRGRLVQSLAQASEAYQRAEREAEQAAAAAGRVNDYFNRLSQQRDVLKDAFGQTGVRSIQAIEREMFNVSQALITLRTEFANGRISVADFERATASAQVRLKTLKAEIETIPGDRSAFEALADGANNLITKFGALTAAIATVGIAVKPVLDSFIALQSTERILTQITGSTAEAARQIEFLRRTSQQAGLAFNDVAASYAKFAASALQAGISAEQTQAAFKAVALATGNLGLSSDQAKRALEALSQIASKGTVSMEELRQQLGDALPGVLPLLAQQLGLTNSELNKLVESGGLTAREAIPALTAAIARLADQDKNVTGLVAAFNRFKNVILEAGTEIVEGPLGQIAGAVLSRLAQAVQGLAFVAVSANEGLKLLGLTTLAFIDLLRGNIKSVEEFKNVVSDFAIQSGSKIADFQQRALGARDATRELAASAQAAAPAVQAQAQATQQAGNAAAEAAPKHTAAAAAVTQAGQAATNAGASMARLRIDYANASEAAQQATRIAETLAEARGKEGKALEQIARLTGDETRAKLAAVEATQSEAEARRLVADARQRELDILQRQRAEEEQRLTVAGKLDDEAKKYLATLDERIAKVRASAENDREAAAAMEAQAAAARLAADTMLDSTSRYEQYRREVEFATLALESAREEHRRGLITTDQLRAATTNLALAQGRLRDSIEDTLASSARYTQQKQADNAVVQAQLQLQLQEAQNRVKLAEVTGNETAAARARLEVKEVEVRIARQKADAMVAEAREQQRSIEQYREELRLAGTLTPQKETELNLRLQNARAKELEGQAGQTAVRSLELEIDATRRLAQARAALAAVPPANAIGAMDNSRAFDGFGTSREQRLGNQTGPVDNSYVFQLRDRLRKGDKFGPDEIPAIQNALASARVNARLTTGSSVQGLAGNADAIGWVKTLEQVLARAQQEAAIIGMTGGTAGPSAAAPTASPAAAMPAVTTARAVTVNIPGLGVNTLNMASAADAARLEAMLRALEQAATRAAG